MQLTKQQKACVSRALESTRRYMSIEGPSHSGKTETLKSIVKSLGLLRFTCHIIAPPHITNVESDMPQLKMNFPTVRTISQLLELTNPNIVMNPEAAQTRLSFLLKPKDIITKQKKRKRGKPAAPPNTSFRSWKSLPQKRTCIVIDEVHLWSSDWILCLDNMLRSIVGNISSFGGFRIIVAGDPGAVRAGVPEWSRASVCASTLTASSNVFVLSTIFGPYSEHALQVMSELRVVSTPEIKDRFRAARDVASDSKWVQSILESATDGSAETKEPDDSVYDGRVVLDNRRYRDRSYKDDPAWIVKIGQIVQIKTTAKFGRVVHATEHGKSAAAYDEFVVQFHDGTECLHKRDELIARPVVGMDILCGIMVPKLTYILDAGTDWYWLASRVRDPNDIQVIVPILQSDL